MRNRIQGVMVGVLLGLCTVAMADPVPLDDFIKHAEYSGAKISPNGKYLAMTVQEQEQYLLVVLDIAEMKIVNTVKLPEEKSVLQFEWSGPERLVFNASRNFGSYARPFATGEWFAVNADGSKGVPLIAYDTGSSRIETSRQVSYQDQYSLLSVLPKDGKQILMTVSSTAATSVVALDTESGQRRLVTRIAQPGCEFALDAAYAPVLAVCADLGEGRDSYEEAHTKLYRVDPEGHWQLLGGSRANGQRLTIVGTAADGRVYGLSDDLAHPAAFGYVDPTTGGFTKVFQDAAAEPDHFIRASDGRTILAVITAAGTPHVEMVDGSSPDTALYASLANSFPGQLVDLTSATQDGRRIIVSVRSDRNPGELYLFDRDTGKARFLIKGRMQIDPKRMASVKAFELKSRDGMTLHGYLTIPNGSDGKNLPMIVNPHGGPTGPRDEWGFNSETQLLASRGYLVLQVNYRGSGGYGQAFRDASYGQWAQGIMNDIIDATHWAIDRGYADKERVCIYGGSFGGYASLMAPAREPGLYKCAFGYVGLYDAQIQFKKSDTSKTDAGRRYLMRALGATAAEQDAMSPINHVQDIKLPVYLAAGARDPRCPPEHTEAMYKALSDAGNKPEGLIIQPGEMHGFYKEESNRKLYTEMLDFFDRHIGTKKAAHAGM
jgi:dipeptidyl aminopeptidase/acylaminoacyl peptidase